VGSATTYPLWLAEVTAASPEMLGLVMVQDDPHGWRLDRAAQSAAVRDALADGTATAEALRARFPDLTPQEIAREFGVPVETVDDEPMIGSLWRFAEYRQRPPRILLYIRGIAPLGRAIARPVAARLLGQASVADVFVAHELFHHAEAIRPDTPIARRHRPTILRIGKWHWRTGIAALAEIAAGSFAQALLDLPCHPKVLDLIVLETVSAEAAGRRVATRIAAIGASHCDSRRSVIGGM
jgi:hypothetical protein